MGVTAAPAAAENSLACAIMRRPTEISIQRRDPSRGIRHTNKSKQTHDTTKDFDNENLDEQVRVCGVRKRCGRTCDADRDTTQEVASTDSQSTPEQCKACSTYQGSEACPDISWLISEPVKQFSLVQIAVSGIAAIFAEYTMPMIYMGMFRALNSSVIQKDIQHHRWPRLHRK